MVIGHEIGHIKAGHLNWIWLLSPGLFVPFLGAAYSRARERTCDRYGLALSGSDDGAVRGLAILAAGGKLGPEVNLEAMVEQITSLQGAWMTIGRWLSGYPTLAERVEALKPALGEGLPKGRGPVLACGLMVAVLVLLPLAVAGLFVAFVLPSIRAIEDIGVGGDFELVDEYDDSEYDYEGTLGPEELEAAAARVESDAQELAAGIQLFYQRNEVLPESLDIIFELWESWYPGTEPPVDPYDGAPFGYEPDEEGFTLWSSGPDSTAETEDDLYFGFQAQ